MASKKPKIKRKYVAKIPDKKRPLAHWVAFYSLLFLFIFGIMYYVIVGDNRSGVDYQSPKPINEQYNIYK